MQTKNIRVETNVIIMRNLENYTDWEEDGYLAIKDKTWQVLLGMKKKGFGVGKYNGFGGGRKENESSKECAIREVYEEAGIVIRNLEWKGSIDFTINDEFQDHAVCLYRVFDFTGVPKETDEMIPKWFDIDKIPYDQMWEDNIYWLPFLLEGEIICGSADFDSNYKLIKHNIIHSFDERDY